MAKPGLTIKVPRTGRVRPPNLDQGDLTFVGRVMVQMQKKRWAQAINANDHVAKKLSKKYLFIKIKRRGVSRPVRDMNLTGATIAGFALRKAINGQIRAENTTRETRRRAQRAQRYDEMIGFASTDSESVFRAAQLKYGQLMKKAWIPLG